MDDVEAADVDLNVIKVRIGYVVSAFDRTLCDCIACKHLRASQSS